MLLYLKKISYQILCFQRQNNSDRKNRKEGFIDIFQ
jgi:hypothetical protein